MGKKMVWQTKEEREALHRAKLHLARTLRHLFASTSHYNQGKMAAILKTSRTIVARCELGRVERLSFNQLFRF